MESVGEFANNKIGGQESILLQCSAQAIKFWLGDLSLKRKFIYCVDASGASSGKIEVVVDCVTVRVSRVSCSDLSLKFD